MVFLDSIKAGRNPRSAPSSLKDRVASHEARCTDASVFIPQGHGSAQDKSTYLNPISLMSSHGEAVGLGDRVIAGI